MAKSTALRNDILKLLFNATAIANVADNAASAPITNVYLSLHTSDPGIGGNQTTNEIGYTSYARVAVVRTSSGWTITSNSVSPNADISFPLGTGGSGTATHVGVGTDASGTGKLWYSGALDASIICGSGVTPKIAAGSTITET